MRLTFRNSEFVLQDVKDELIVDKLRKNHWKYLKLNNYSTTSITAAAKFRQRYADKIAEKVFTRTFVKFYDAPSSPLPTFLDEHQRTGVNFILTRSRSYLAHAPGAGKTAQAIVAAIFTSEPGQILFIVPPNLSTNWFREIHKWTDPIFSLKPLTVTIIPESKYKNEVDWMSEVIICPDSMLTKVWVYEKLERLEFKFVAVDEASRFKEPTSLRTRALFGGRSDTYNYTGLVYEAKHAVLLDGSPMPNRPIELWAPVTAMAPETIDFMSQHDFGMRYCAGFYDSKPYASNWDYSGSSNEEELKEKLQKSFMHVVTEGELNHPERLRSFLYMDGGLSKKVKALQRTALDEFDFKNPQEHLFSLNLATYRRELGLSKIKWVSSYIRNRLQIKRQESILLFAWHREVCEGLKKELSDFLPFIVMGGTTNEEREKAFEAFQSGKCRLLIGNIQAMGRGHNLQRADRVVFAEYSWTDELNKQCEKRASRKGSTKEHVRCEYVVGENTLDEIILKSVLRKAKSVEAVIG